MSRPAIVTSAPTPLPRHELLARVFRTLGDATRLQLLEAVLDAGVATQSQLLDRVDASQSRVSEHLGCLIWCGFVAAERRGRTVRYHVIDHRAAEFIELARAFLDVNDYAVGHCTVLEGS